jgi:RsiW-degrading membrane proteinase PrsW (M82 family)
VEHLIISKETAVNEEKSKRGKWTLARVAQWWGAILASLAVLGLQVFYYKWRPSDIMINVLVSLAVWYFVFLVVAWLITDVIALFRRTRNP